MDDSADEFKLPSHDVANDFFPETEDDEEEESEAIASLLEEERKMKEAKRSAALAALGDDASSSNVRSNQESTQPTGPVQTSSGVVGEGSNGESTEATVQDDFNTKFLDNRWIGKYESTGIYMKHVGTEWIPLNEDEEELIRQLWMEQEVQQKQAEGPKMKWNEETNQWEPINIDEDFIAQYQASYGVQHDYSEIEEKLRAREAQRLKEEEEKQEKKLLKKRGAPAQPLGWVDMEEKVHAVYVSQLPLDLTDEEFAEFMAKCGVLQLDARTEKPKLKLYKDSDGNNKGDGRCCYVKKESVDLALNILDGFLLKGKMVKVEKAKFELKGEFDPKKKKAKMSAAQKKRFMENQNKAFEWTPEKPRNYRPKSDCVVIIKNLFTLEMLDKNAALLLDLKEEVEQSCTKYGVVKKVVVYDHNPEGVVSVKFENTEHSDLAVKMLNGRIVDGRKLTAELWDGTTKYFREESEEDRQRRQAAWQNYISKEKEEGEEEEEKSTGDEAKQEQTEMAETGDNDNLVEPQDKEDE